MITQSNFLYTWGASPQLIRLLNQSRKRARMAQKFEETKSALTFTAELTAKLTNSQNVNAHDGSLNDVRSQNHETENRESLDSNVQNSAADNAESSEQSDPFDAAKSLANKFTSGNLQDKIKNFLRTEIKQPTEKNSEPDAASKINSEFYLDDEYTEHYLPQQVDTCDVVGEMVQVSVGTAQLRDR